MKNEIIASNLSAFDTLFDNLIRRIEQAGEKIVKSRFTFYHGPVDGYRAIVWTKHENKEAK